MLQTSQEQLVSTDLELNMKNPEILIIDAAKNLEILREMTDKEYKERLAEISINQKIEDEKNLEAQTKAQSRIDLLSKLGITAEEATLLLG